MTLPLILAGMVATVAPVEALPLRSISVAEHRYTVYGDDSSQHSVGIGETVIVPASPWLVALAGVTADLYSDREEYEGKGGVVFLYGGGFYGETSGTFFYRRADDGTTAGSGGSAYADLSYENGFLYLNGGIRGEWHPGDRALIVTPTVRFYQVGPLWLWLRYTGRFPSEPAGAADSHGFWSEVEGRLTEPVRLRAGATISVSDGERDEWSALGGVNWAITESVTVKLGTAVAFRETSNSVTTTVSVDVR